MVVQESVGGGGGGGSRWRIRKILNFLLIELLEIFA